MAASDQKVFGILALTLIFCVFANGLAIKHTYRLDLTTAQIYSISDKALEVIQKISKPVHIVFAYDLRNRALKDSADALRVFADKSKFITVELFDPILEPSIAKANNIRFSGSGLFESEGRTVYFNEPTEVGFINALIRVTRDEIGLVCFSDGHLESNPFSLQTHDHAEDTISEHNHSTGGRPITLHERHGMGMARKSLELLGYKVEQRMLLQGSKSLEDCSVLVVASPQAEFHPIEVDAINDFLERSGRALFLLEPDVRTKLEEILNDYEISVGNKRLKDLDDHYWADPSTPAVTNYPRHRATRDLPLTFFPGALELTPIESKKDRMLNTNILVSTGPKTVLEGEDGPYRPRAIGVITKDLDTEAVLITMGDGDFATNSFFSLLGNGSLFINLINELVREVDTADITPRHYVEGRLTLSRSQLNLVFFTNVFLGPILLFCIGGVIWRRRR